jgi:hypothetical protein
VPVHLTPDDGHYLNVAENPSSDLALSVRHDFFKMRRISMSKVEHHKSIRRTPKRLKTGIRVDGLFPVACHYEDFEEIKETVGNGRPISIELIPYPRHFARPRICVCADENGAYKPLPYNGWGLVGTFCVVKINSNGDLISLTRGESDGICRELLSREGWTGYLDPNAGVLTPFLNAFKQHGIPPLGWRPNACWFQR